MDSIKIHIINSSGSLDDIENVINSAFQKASAQAVGDFNLDKVDVLFIDDPRSVIPELGVSGYSPSGSLIYIYLDSSANPKEEDIYATLLHEFHHSKRWRDPGYGETLWETLVTEGLACVYGEQITGSRPIYVANKDNPLELLDALKLDDSNYNHFEIFITGNKHLPRWFGYFAGYEIAKFLLENKNIDSIEAVNKKFKLDQKKLSGQLQQTA